MSTKNREKVRSIFISDVHLGCKYCKAEALLAFLRNTDTETLYLVGDIVDGWKMQKGVYWTDTYSFIVRRIIGMIKDGTKVVYVAGNHDEFLRGFLPNAFGHVELVDEFIHETVDGKKLLIIHGDIFDQLTIRFSWLYHLGDTAYSVAMWINEKINIVRRTLGFKYYSFSMLLKQNVKQAVSFINNFERFIVKHTKENNCQGVICGHIHVPAVKQLDDIEYYNCGDWVESCSVLLEHLDGRMELRIDVIEEKII